MARRLFRVFIFEIHNFVIVISSHVLCVYHGIICRLPVVCKMSADVAQLAVLMGLPTHTGTTAVITKVSYYTRFPCCRNSLPSIFITKYHDASYIRADMCR